MSLVLWTSASASDVKSVIGTVVAQHQIIHRIVSDTSQLPTGTTTEDVVLAFGSKALAVLQEAKVIPKGRTVTSTREKVVVHGGVRYLVSFDPGIASRDYARLPEIQWDVQLAIRLHQTGGVKPVLGTYRYVESLHELIQEIENRYMRTGKPVDLACDLETKSLNPYAPKAWIIAASFTLDEGTADVLYFTKDEAPTRPLPWTTDEEMTYWEGLWQQINWLLTTTKVSLRGANFKYDANWIFLKWGIACTNQKFDTMLVGSLLDENRSNSLKLHAKIMTPLGGYEDDMAKYDFSCLEVVPKPEMLNYVGGDTDVTYRVAKIMRRDILKDPKLSNFYVKLLQPAAKAFEKLERNGVLIDRPYYDKLQTELDAEIARLQQEMLRCMPNKLRIKHKDSIADSIADGKSPFKPAILKEFLFTPAGLNLKPLMVTEKTKEPSTSMDHLMMFGDNPDAANFISFFKEMGSAQKTQSTYVVGFLKHLRADGRFHATYMMHRGDYGSNNDDSGTNTGRTSAKDPAVQCLPCWVNVLTSTGHQTILSIVEGYENGGSFKVPTHDGSLREVIGVYRNGVRPVLRITFESGRVVDCTENHPLLTSLGFMRAEHLRAGDLCYGSNSRKEIWETGGIKEGHGDRRTERPIPMPVRLRGGDGCASVQPVHGGNEVLRVLEGGVQQDTRAHDAHDAEQNLHLLEEHQEEVLQPKSRFVQELRSARDSSLRTVAHVRELFVGHGGDARGSLDRTQGERQGLRAGELQMDSSEQAEQKQAQHGAADSQRENSGLGRLVGRDWASSVCVGLEEQSRVEFGSGTHHAKEAEVAGFALDAIKCIEYLEEFETFDLTIEGSHSFVANGMVVHNTIPKHSKWAKKLRKAYIAPPGKVILNCDFSQGELRITAVVANEPVMIQAYMENKDLHAITASKLNGYEFDEFMLLPEDVRDELRSGGKAGNFGLIYGMQHRGYKEYAYLTYGVSMTEDEAFNSREAFFDLYSRLPAWHDEYKAHAHNWGFVRSPLGRVRHLPLINSKDREVVAQSERQSINAPIQSCLSDMMQLAMVHIDREYGHEDIEMFLMCHDALSLYVPEDDAVQWASRIKYVMENLPLARDFGWNSPLKFTADAEVGLNLAELKKLKGL